MFDIDIFLIVCISFYEKKIFACKNTSEDFFIHKILTTILLNDYFFFNCIHDFRLMADRLLMHRAQQLNHKLVGKVA